jgi:hypothetical protein
LKPIAVKASVVQFLYLIAITHKGFWVAEQGQDLFWLFGKWAML